MTDPIQVTQADRDAASDLLIETGMEADHFPQDVRDGELDNTRIVQAFARHRLASTPSPAAGELGELAERLRKYAAIYGSDWDGGDEYTQAADAILSLLAERDAALAREAKLRESFQTINRLTSPGNRTLDDFIRDMGLACDIARSTLNEGTRNDD